MAQYVRLRFRWRKSTVVTSRPCSKMNQLSSKPVVIGRQQHVVETLPGVGLIVVWGVILLSEGWKEGLKYGWIAAIGLAAVARMSCMRLQLRDRTLERPVVGPWRRSVNLDSLESIRWKHTGGAASKGTMFARDRDGHELPIYVGMFTGGDVWGKLLLDSAKRTGATIDKHSRDILEAEVATGDDRP